MAEKSRERRTSTLLRRLLLSSYWPDQVTWQLLAARSLGNVVRETHGEQSTDRTSCF